MSVFRETSPFLVLPCPHLDDTKHFPHVPSNNHDFTYEPDNSCFVTVSSPPVAGGAQGKGHCLGKRWRSWVSNLPVFLMVRFPGKSIRYKLSICGMNKLHKKELMRKGPRVELSNLTHRGNLAAVGCRERVDNRERGLHSWERAEDLSFKVFILKCFQCECSIFMCLCWLCLRYRIRSSFLLGVTFDFV